MNLNAFNFQILLWIYRLYRLLTALMLIVILDISLTPYIFDQSVSTKKATFLDMFCCAQPLLHFKGGMS